MSLSLFVCEISFFILLSLSLSPFFIFSFLLLYESFQLHCCQWLCFIHLSRFLSLNLLMCLYLTEPYTLTLHLSRYLSPLLHTVFPWRYWYKLRSSLAIMYIFNRELNRDLLKNAVDKMCDQHLYMCYVPSGLQLNLLACKKWTGLFTVYWKTDF